MILSKNMTDTDHRLLMTELLNKDRLGYVMIIMNSQNGVGSREIAEEISELGGMTEEEEIKKANIMINKRLRKLVDLGILISVDKKYKLSGLGYSLFDSWQNIVENVDAMEKFGDFFDDHLVNDIPREFFRQMYKLRSAELAQNATQWGNMLREQMKKTERKIYNMTQYLHDFPDHILKKKKKDEINIVITYQFNKYPQLNYSDEKVLFEKLVEVETEFRYIKLEDRHPLGIRVIDEKWATFLLPKPEKTNEKHELDRGQAFVGTDLEFVSWCRDLMYHIWSFEAKSLNVDEVEEAARI